MDITVNGQAEQIASSTIADFVHQRGLNPVALVVELNERVVPADQWASIRLGDGDRIELLNFVGGG